MQKLSLSDPSAKAGAGGRGETEEGGSGDSCHPFPRTGCLGGGGFSELHRPGLGGSMSECVLQEPLCSHEEATTRAPR